MMKQMKQKGLITIFLMFLFIGAYSKTEAIEPHFDQQLLQLAQEMEKQPFTITNWSLYSREIRDIPNLSTFKKQVNDLKLTNKRFKWSKSGEKGYYEQYDGTHKMENSGLVETISLMLYPQKKSYKAYVIYSVTGSNWNKANWDQFSPTVKARMSQLFHHSPQIFSCMTGEYGGTMDIILSKRANDILHDFSATKVEQLNEKTFVSFSAYTNVWKQSIQTNDHQMNLQVALRHVGGKTTLTIGTPIITTEY